MSVVGYGVKGFYCCDNLTSVKFSFSENAQNYQVKTTDKSDCCKTKYQYFKVKDNHFAADHINAPANFLAEVPVFHDSFKPELFVSQKINIANPGNAPPLYNGVSLFVATCTYLI
jgi:hypothetical protein